MNVDISGILTNCSQRGIITLNKKGTPECVCDDLYTGASCQISLDPCQRNPCLNGGICEINRVRKSFNCHCNQLYHGTRCEHKVDYCANKFCSKHGICNSEMNNTWCSCYTLYEGLDCENKSKKLFIIQLVIKTSSIAAIIFIILFYILIFLLDVWSFYDKKSKRRVSSRKKSN